MGNKKKDPFGPKKFLIERVGFEQAKEYSSKKCAELLTPILKHNLTSRERNCLTLSFALGGDDREWYRVHKVADKLRISMPDVVNASSTGIVKIQRLLRISVPMKKVS
jgi:DNA-directed RNA polymerase sigma subunit (sigma70/sigma32)